MLTIMMRDSDPLSMLLYLFYNADLIASLKKEEAMITYVDDASYYAEGTNFEEAYDRLRNMMNREIRAGTSGRTSITHNSSQGRWL